jgi:hypothetical protein
MALTADKFIVPNGVPSVGVQKMQSSTIGITDLWDFGIFDYRNTLAPQSLTGGNTIVLNNNGGGVNTYKKLPDTNVTDLWLTSTNKFDFSDLNIGDMIDIRLDLEVTTTAVNQTFSIDLEMGQGGTIETVPFVINQEHKAAGAVAVNRYNGIYMRNANSIVRSAQFKITSADDLTVDVHGWYCKLIKKGR